MKQISSNICANTEQGFSRNGKMKFIDSLTECFSEYFSDMFRDFGEILSKRLQNQSSKIQQNERLLKDLKSKIESGSFASLTSLAQVQLNENQSQTSRVESLSTHSTKESSQLVQVNQAIKKLEQGIQYLEASLTFMKSKKSIQDPEITNTIEGPSIKDSKSNIIKDENSTTTMSKIQKLTSKINRFEKESSIEQIQKNSGLAKPKKLQKSRSLITLSNRRYHPVSCPKRYEYGIFRTNNNHTNSESQLVLPFCEEYSHTLTNFSSLLHENQSVFFLQENSRISEPNNNNNKMPLINRSKSVLNQLLSLVRDQSDANIVMFYLKKGLKSLEQQIDAKEKLTKKYEQNKGWEKKGNNFQSSQQYSMNRRQNTLQVNNNNTFDSNKQVINSACSITQMLPNSDCELSWIKENYTSTIISPENQAYRGGMHQNSQLNVGSKVSRQKRKYFQRTSNDQNTSLLKNNRFRSNC